MARNEGTVVVRVIGEIREFAGKMRAASGEVSSFGKRTEAVFSNSFSKLTSGIASKFGALGSQLTGALQSAGSSAVASGGPWGAIAAGATAATAAVVGFVKEGVSSFQSLASQIRTVERLTGEDAETSSRLVAIQRAMNIETSAGARAFGMLEKTIGTNSKKLQEAGVEIARNKDGSVSLYGTLMNVRRAYQAVGGGVEGAAVAAAAFGRNYQALLPILNATDERLRQIDESSRLHHEWLSQDQLDKARDLSIATTELHHSLEGLSIEVGSDVVPAVEFMAEELTTLVEASDKAARSVGRFEKRLWEAVPGIKLVEWGARKLIKGHRDSAAATDSATDSIDDATDAFGAEGDAARAAADGLKAYDEMLRGITDSVLGIPSAMDDVNQAFLDLEGNADKSTSKAADAQSRLADAIESSNRRIRDAEQDLADATEDLNKQSSGDRTDARRRVRDAEERLADARADSAKSIADAKKNTEDLNPSLEDSNRKSLAIKHNMEGVVSAVEKTAEEMIKNKRPTAEILGYIISQRDRLGEIGRKLGANRSELQLYLDTLTQVYQSTKDLANLVNSQSPGMFKSYSPGWGVELNPLANSTPTVIQNFYGPANPADQQREASLSWSREFRRRG